MSTPTPDFELRFPPLILCGWGERRALPAVLAEILGGDSPVRLYLVASGSALHGKAGGEVRRLCADVLCGEFSAVPHDPPLTVVDDVVQRIRASGANAVLGLGGGSVLDTAKAAAIVAPHGPSVIPFFRGERSMESPGLPFVAMPTTAGTGAEVTSNAVLTDSERREKKSLRSPHMVPRVALVDAELTVSQTPEQTAWSGLDALTQAVESYISRKAHGVSRALAFEAVRRLLAFLPAAVRDGSSRPAREAVAEGSLLSGMAFSQSGLGAVHGLAHPLGLALDLPHGLTCAILLPHVLRLNAPVCREALDELAASASLPGHEALIRHIQTLCVDLGVPAGFACRGLTPAAFPAILANCRSGSMKANPRDLSDADIIALLEQLCRG